MSRVREKPISWEPLDQPEGHRQVDSFPLSPGRPRGWTAACCLLSPRGCAGGGARATTTFPPIVGEASPRLLPRLAWLLTLPQSCCAQSVWFILFPPRSAGWASLSALWLMSLPTSFLLNVSFVWFACVIQDLLQGRVLAGELSGLPNVTGPLSSQLTPAWPDSEAVFTGMFPQLRQACRVLCTRCC